MQRCKKIKFSFKEFKVYRGDRQADGQNLPFNVIRNILMCVVLEAHSKMDTQC